MFDKHLIYKTKLKLQSTLTINTMSNFFAIAILDKIQTELVNRKIDSSIVNQITGFLKPRLENIDLANISQNAQNIKNQFGGFLETHKDKIGQENLDKIQKTVGAVMSVETLQKLQNGDLVPGTDIDNGIIAKIKGWLGMGKK